MSKNLVAIILVVILLPVVSVTLFVVFVLFFKAPFKYLKHDELTSCLSKPNPTWASLVDCLRPYINERTPETWEDVAIRGNEKIRRVIEHRDAEFSGTPNPYYPEVAISANQVQVVYKIDTDHHSGSWGSGGWDDYTCFVYVGRGDKLLGWWDRPAR
ncbi:MAG: hypothetical protein KBG84_05700 [Planctomycetes bacterium]|nr:hypothetical protein [Planctomycetota bacterium]